jgi:AcrR family transcriptional regulator
MAGRPRSPEADRALLGATRDLVTRDGYEAVTIEMIAKRAGTGRQTIYRRWPGKAELVLDAFITPLHIEIHLPPHGTTAWEEEVVDLVVDTFAALERTTPALRSLMAHAQTDAGFRTQLRDRLILPRGAALRNLLEDGVRREVLPLGAPLDAAVATLYGALWYRLLLDEPLDRAFAQEVTSLVLAGLRTVTSP